MTRALRAFTLVAALALAGGHSLRAQDSGARLADGKPDFSGIYTQPSTVNATGPRGNLIFNADKMAPVKPGAESLLYRARTGDARVDEPRAMCLPAGFPSGMLYILPIQIVHTAKSIVIIPELQRAARITPTDGRPHREGIEPSYYGDSVGKWDGDTLVIESVNFKEWILDDYHYTDPTKSRWHTDALRTTERLRREGNKLQYQITIDDSKIFTRPFSQDFELTLRPDWEKLGLLEYVCEENNRCAGGHCAGPARSSSRRPRGSRRSSRRSRGMNVVRPRRVSKKRVSAGAAAPAAYAVVKHRACWRQRGVRAGLAVLLVLSGALVQPAMGQTLSPARVMDLYQQLTWQDPDGLPANGVGAIAQTADGYLWLATAEGAVRFDGVRFTTFDRTNTPEIRSNNIQSLLVDRSGALWLGSHAGGVTRYQAGRFTHFSRDDGLPDSRAYCLFEDARGGIWVGTEAGVSLFQDDRFTTYSTTAGLPDNRVYALTDDGVGGLWIGTLGGLAHFQNGRFTTYTTSDGLPSDAVRSLARDQSGDLWVGTDAGLARFHADRFTAYGTREGVKAFPVKALAIDRRGALWVGTIGDGLYRYEHGRFLTATIRDGLADDDVQAIHQDPDGNLWLGTSGAGLVQLRVGRFRAYTTRDGLPDDLVRPIIEDRSGRIWVGTDAGLAQLEAGRFSTYRTADGQPYRYITGIQEDRAGNLWIDTYRSGSVSNVIARGARPPRADAIRAGWDKRLFTAMLDDRSGALWFGTASDGLHRLQDGHATAYRPADGLADHHVTRLFEDRAGRVWIATAGGLSRFSDDRITTFTARDGFTATHVLSFHEDRAGQVWIGTYGDGLYRYADGRFAVVRASDGLYDNLAYEILEDDHGNLWMSGNKGIYRASLQELNAVADGRAASVRSFAYGAADGMLSREANGANPAGLKARDGTLWFPTIRGVVVVDPRQDREPPVVVIEGVTVDGQPPRPDEAIRLRPGQGNLEIQYTALSWARAPQISFKYQVVGLDHDWVDAGTRRTAYFPHLPPGSYTFRVIADNGEGVWNTEGQSLAIVVLPPFYRTAWFMAVAAAVLIGLVLGGARLRIRQVENERNAQQVFSRMLLASQEEERRRIAAELHDSLGQSLLIIKNRIALARGDGAAAAVDSDVVREQLDELTASTADAISECREIAYNLRPYYLSRFGLTRTLESMFLRIGEVTAIAASAQMDPIDHVLTDDAQVNVYRIVQECVNNIIKHSHATAATLAVRRLDERIVLVVRDNGVGFAATVRAPGNGDGPAGRFGMMGIAERVRMLGGQVDIESAVGTTIRISLPVS